MDFTIEPISFPRYATRIKVEVSVILEKKAIVKVNFFEQGAEYQCLESKYLVIEGDEYNAWTSDDNYIKNLVFSKLNITLLPERVEEIISA